MQKLWGHFFSGQFVEVFVFFVLLSVYFQPASAITGADPAVSYGFAITDESSTGPIHQVFYSNTVLALSVDLYSHYFAAESDGRVRLVGNVGECPTRPASPVLCLHRFGLQQDSVGSWKQRIKQGHASASYSRADGSWNVAVPDPDFVGHELGHTLGFLDLYDLADPKPANGYLMDFVDGRNRGLSLYQLRHAGWATVRAYQPSLSATTLYPLDQLQFCGGTRCYTIGLHFRPVTGGDPEPMIFEAELADSTVHDAVLIPQVEQLQYRRVGLDPARGRWQIPPVVGPWGHIYWQFIPEPIPHIRVQIDATGISQPGGARPPVAPSGPLGAALGGGMILVLIVLLSRRGTSQNQ